MKKKITGRCWKVHCQQWACANKNTRIVLFYYATQLTAFFLSFRPYVILSIGVAVLGIVFLFYFLITYGNPPKDVLFFGK